MYRIRTPGCSKSNQAQRWALPDRVFFACGACHILAYAFLERHGQPGQEALWIRPIPGHTGNHIVVATDAWVFDYHGYTDRARYVAHTWRRARLAWPGWDAMLVSLPRDVLVSEQKSKASPGSGCGSPASSSMTPCRGRAASSTVFRLQTRLSAAPDTPRRARTDTVRRTPRHRPCGSRFRSPACSGGAGRPAARRPGRRRAPGPGRRRPDG